MFHSQQLLISHERTVQRVGRERKCLLMILESPRRGWRRFFEINRECDQEFVLWGPFLCKRIEFDLFDLIWNQIKFDTFAQGPNLHSQWRVPDNAPIGWSDFEKCMPLVRRKEELPWIPKPLFYARYLREDARMCLKTLAKELQLIFFWIDQWSRHIAILQHLKGDSWATECFFSS